MERQANRPPAGAAMFSSSGIRPTSSLWEDVNLQFLTNQQASVQAKNRENPVQKNDLFKGMNNVPDDEDSAEVKHQRRPNRKVVQKSEE